MNVPPAIDFQEQVQQNYDRISRIYDLLSGGTEKRLIRKVIGTLKIAVPKKVIEIGCGTGNGLIALQEKYPSAVLCGIDLSFGMCLRSSRKVMHQNPSSHSLICQGDALQLPFPNKDADLVFISFTFELFPDALQSALLHEIKRILAPEGYISVISMYKEYESGWMSRLYAAAHARFPKVIDCQPLDGPAIFRRFGFQVFNETNHHIWGIPVVSFMGNMQE